MTEEELYYRWPWAYAASQKNLNIEISIAEMRLQLLKDRKTIISKHLPEQDNTTQHNRQWDKDQLDNDILFAELWLKALEKRKLHEETTPHTTQHKRKRARKRVMNFCVIEFWSMSLPNRPSPLWIIKTKWLSLCRWLWDKDSRDTNMQIMNKWLQRLWPWSQHNTTQHNTTQEDKKMNKLVTTLIIGSLLSMSANAQWMMAPGVPAMPGVPPLPMPSSAGNFANSSSFVKSYSYSNVQSYGQPVVITNGGVVTNMPGTRVNTNSFSQSNFNQNINSFRRFR